MARSIQAVRGMNDILPDQEHIWEFFEQTIREWVVAYGYRNIRMPIVEHTDLFVRSIGAVTDIVEKEMYTFLDHLNGDSLTLRPEGTASCVRAALEHNLLYAGPQRLYYSGPMFRHERPQKGRYRQFHQVGVEALGYTGPDIDAELIVMCADLWKRLGISNVCLQISTLGSVESRILYRSRLIEYLEKNLDKLDEDARRRLYSNPLRVLDRKNPEMQEIIGDAPGLLENLDEDSLRHSDKLQQILIDQGIEFEINPRLVRGLDYYNRTVFEWGTDKLGAQGTICAGGRYDGLVEQIGGKPTPACGFAMGVERLLALIAECGKEIPNSVLDVYVIHHGESTDGPTWKTVGYLRNQGLNVILHCGGGGFKAQMKKANASGARFAVILGEDEIQAGVISVKPLREEVKQVKIGLVEAVGLLKGI
ncbi:MAG: histidine--tRNA ligase [Nitrosomonadales bacterium]|nr:MAG: histidine--tRNA ligase [Nitrosomonadales bacterium]